jgi:hypothetical protein
MAVTQRNLLRLYIEKDFVGIHPSISLPGRKGITTRSEIDDTAICKYRAAMIARSLFSLPAQTITHKNFNPSGSTAVWLISMLRGSNGRGITPCLVYLNLARSYINPLSAIVSPSVADREHRQNYQDDRSHKSSPISGRNS